MSEQVNQELQKTEKKEEISNNNPQENTNESKIPSNTIEQSNKSEENQINENYQKYVFSPIEAFLINKKLLKGFKLESEEELIREKEVANIVPKKKNKNTTKFSDRPKKPRIKKYDNIEGESSQSNFNKQKQQNKELGSLGTSTRGVLQKNSNEDIKKIKHKCEVVINKIKEYQGAEFFYHSKSQGALSLSVIDKKNQSFSYKSFNEFCLEIRKLWGYYLQSYVSSPEIYQKVLKISDFSEKIISEADNEVNEYDENKPKNVNNLLQRCKKLHKEAVDMRGNYMNNMNNNDNLGSNLHSGMKDAKKKNLNINNENMKQMTLEEKNSLGISIRSLNKEQLKGIVNILKDNNGDKQTNNKYFEFDIDKLPIKKLRELEKYVKNCIDNSNNSNNFNNANNINQNEQKNHNNINNNEKNLGQHQKWNNSDNKKDNKEIKQSENKQKEVVSKKESDSDSSMSPDSSLSSLDDQ